MLWEVMEWLATQQKNIDDKIESINNNPNIDSSILENVMIEKNKNDNDIQHFVEIMKLANAPSI